MPSFDLNDPKGRADALEWQKQVLHVQDEAKRAFRAEQSGSTTLPEILTLRERLARPRKETVWRIDQLQRAGHRVFFTAQFKAGKTTLAANLVRSVLDGDQFLDTFKTTVIDGTLALFDFEMDGDQLDDWYRDQKIQHDDRLVVFPMRGAATLFNILDKDVLHYWVELLKARGVKYLILDCLRPVLDALGLNEHTEVGLFLTPFDALLREANIPEAVVVQHMGHQGERARGDSRQLDWPDATWKMTREKAKDGEVDPAAPRFFSAYGRDVDVPETQLVYDAKTRRLALLVSGDGQGSSRADAKSRAAMDAIYQFVSTAEDAPSGVEIQKAVMPRGHTQANVREALRDAVTSGVLVEGKGKNGGKAYSAAGLHVEPGFLDSLKLGKSGI